MQETINYVDILKMQYHLSPVPMWCMCICVRACVIACVRACACWCTLLGVPSATYYTMHVAGAAYLTAGQKIAMWVYSNSDPTYQIDTESTFSVFYIGGKAKVLFLLFEISA